MSWLKGFEKVKNFAAEVQSALSEEPEDEDPQNPVRELQVTKVKCEELTDLITTQEKEIAAQRKQIIELQQKLKVTDEASTSKTTATETKDSWFWDDSDTAGTPSTSSSSKTKDEHGESPVIVSSDLTNIPLDSATNDQELHKQIFDKEQKLKKLTLENAILNEKLTQISSENRELNENIEELDKQHCVATENLLVMKQALHAQLINLQEDHDQLIKKNIEDEQQKIHEISALKTENNNLKKSLAELKNSIDKIEKSYMTSVQENVAHQKEIELMKSELKNLACSNTDLEAQIGLQETGRNQIEADFSELKNKYEELEKQYNAATKQHPTSDAAEKELLDKLKSVEVEKCKIEQDFIALQEDDLNLQREHNQLKLSFDELQANLQEKKEHEMQLSVMQVEKKQWEQDFHVLQDEELLLQTEHRELKQKLATLEEQWQSNSLATIQFEDLQSKLTAEELAKKQIEQDFIALKQTDLTLQKDFQNLQENYDSLQKKLEKANAKTPDSAKEKELADKLQTIEVEKLKIEQDFIALQDDDLSLQTEYRNLKEAYDELEQNFKATEAARLRCEESMVSLSENESPDTSQNKRKHQDFNESTEVVLLKKQMTDFENELSVLNLENTKLKEHSEIDRNQLEEQLFTLEETYSDIVQKYDELDIKLQSALKDKATAEKELQTLQCNVSTTIDDAEISQLKSENSNICTMNQQMSETYKVISDKLLVAELELSEIKNHFEQKVSKIQNLEQEKSNLTQIIQNLKSHANEKQLQEQQEIVTHDELLDLLKKHLDYEYEPEEKRAEKKHLEDFLRSIKDLQSKHHALERKLIESSKEITSIKDLNSRLQHEKETMKADLLNYEIECSELMKNNDVILTQLENLKSSKLETIHENNEDNIVVLEKQLEQCNNLNENLEEKYHQLQEQLANLMSQQDNSDQEEHQESSVVSRQSAHKTDWNEVYQQLKQQIENLEVDKGNLLFEINELKADRSVLETEMLDYKSRAETSEEQHLAVTEDLSHIVAKIHALEKKHNESNSRYEETIDAQAAMLHENDKELKKLQSSSKASTTLTTQIDDLSKTNETLVNRLKEAEVKDIQHAKLVAELSELRTQCAEHEQSNQSILQEKNDLIALITTKHNENVQYHNEIQRLGQLLYTEIEKNKSLANIEPQSCQNCVQLQEELKAVKENLQDSAETEKMADQIQFLKEKSDILTKNIMMEQSNQKLLNQELVELNEQKLALAKESDRLRQHLVEIEESHTLESVELQKTIEDLRQKLFNIEHDAKQSSTAYTSASIRANQQAETLHAQCLLLQQQRDEIANKLSTYEDHEFKNQAALTNLQCALEQFQKDKERDIEAATYRIQKELEFERQQRASTINEYQSLQKQLAEAKNGLLAAARLSDQLEISSVQNAAMKDELKQFQDKYQSLQTKFTDAESDADKVEKNLVKNLLIGYIVAPNANDKLQILKLIAHVLELNQVESDKVGLGNKSSPGGWLGGILSTGGNANQGNYNKESLAQAFVMFLEKESQPHNPAGPTSLLNLLDQPTASQSTSMPTTSSSSGNKTPDSNNYPVSVAVQPIVLNNENLLHQSFAPQRNSTSILKDILSDT